jgi:nitrogen fixation protein NifB
MTTLALNNHPCFNETVRHSVGRVHLPVAPRCNVQCNFCNRSFDCVNESRPGVTSSLLSPEQGLAYLDYLLAKKPNITVVGIAGPGDPLANPQETLETLNVVRAKYPRMLLCLASNGLNVPDFVQDLAALHVAHVSLTVNTLRTATAAKIYSWVRFGKRVYNGEEGAAILLRNQEETIKRLKAHGIIVKVNTVIIEGINDDEVPEIAETMHRMGVDIMNPMPMVANQLAAFGKEQVPTAATMTKVRQAIASHLPLMTHCARCRADAAGLIGADMSPEELETIKSFARTSQLPRAHGPSGNGKRSYVAVASREGLLINQHLGEAERLMVYGQTPEGIGLIQTLKTPVAGTGDERWRSLGAALHDCSTLLVSGVGARPMAVLQESGVEVIRVEGLIEEVVGQVLKGRDISKLQVPMKKCGEACSGSGMGCC